MVKLVHRAPTVGGFKQVIAGFPCKGLCVIGHNPSSGLPGMFGSAATRGMHMGKPVAEAIVGLSWSTWKRGSGDCPRLKRPVPSAISPTVVMIGSLICTRVPVAQLPKCLPQAFRQWCS